MVVIDDDKVQVIDGSKYWGKGCSAAEHTIKQDLGEDFQVAVIGPAGENLVNIACIGHDYGRQAGRLRDRGGSRLQESEGQCGAGD